MYRPTVRLGWLRGVTDEKGGPGKGGGQDSLTHPLDRPCNYKL